MALIRWSKPMLPGILLALCTLVNSFPQEQPPPPEAGDESVESRTEAPDEDPPQSPDPGDPDTTPDDSPAEPGDERVPSADSFVFRDKEEGPAVIGEIAVDGNVRVSDTAFYNNLRIKPGDEYDERAIRVEFRRLWDLSLFDDLSVESRRRSSGRIDVIFHVRDRPIIGGVEFSGMKAITETGILERLTEAEAEVRRGQPVDFSVLRKAESTIEHMLGEKGHLEAKVRARLTPVHQGQQQVTFHIREGAKTKIKKIDFAGNTVYTDRQLRKMLKLTKEAFWLTSWASTKPLYHPAKLDQDAEGIRTAYRSQGYLDMRIEPEVVELESDVRRREDGVPAVEEEAELDDADELWDESREEPPPPEGETEKERKKRLKKEAKEEKKKAKEEKKSIYLTIPIDEGIQYRVGEVKVEGNSIFSDPEVMARLPLRTGMVFNDSALKFGTRQIEDDYGERGYFYVSIDPQVSREDGIANLTLDVTEDKQYFVDRIEFTGNTTTRDYVLRREMKLGEEDLFNVRAMRLGLRKIAQLGYWQVGGDPQVQARPDSDRLNIEVQGIEANRNEIQVGGGVSGIDGGFFQGSYSTRNFLGRGEIFSAFLTIGQVGSRYSLNFTEPWFMGKPWTLGFSLFNQQTQFTGFDRNGTGGRVILGRILGNFTRLDLIYGLENIDFRPTQPGFVASETTTSSITSILSYDTRNNYFRPTRGLRLVSSLEYAGGALGGDNNFWKLRQDATLYFPGLMPRHYFGVNVSYGYIAPVGDSVVPDFERFYLGGERTLRAFPTRSIGPERRDLDLNGNGFIDLPEDRNGPDGILQPCEDLNNNGVRDLPGEPDLGNCLLDPTEDTNGNFLLDTEDLNNNGILDPGEDINGNGILDTEDRNGDGILQLGEDRPDGFFTPFCAADDINMNGVRDPGEGDNGNCRLDSGEDTNLDGIFGSFFPGGNQYALLNLEYSIPITDTVEFAVFYDAGNAFEESESIRFDDLRVDYGIEMRFFLPVFQAPLRLIYAIIQDPLPGEDPNTFIFSIGTTF